MVAEIARDHETRGLPISAIGGITTWRDAAEFIALGAGTVQVCTAAMTYGFKIVQEMLVGPQRPSWTRKGYRSLADFRGRAVQSVTDWQHLNLNYVTKARDQSGPVHQMRPLPYRLRGHVASGDLRQRRRRTRKFVVNEAECVGCNLCVLVCPVETCITLDHKTEGVDPRTGLPIRPAAAPLDAHPNNPAVQGGGVASASLSARFRAYRARSRISAAIEFRSP